MAAVTSPGVPTLPSGTATGVGSMPGTDPYEATRIIAGELPGLPHLPEMPARGAGAALPGRAAAILVDLPLEILAGRWRTAGRPGIDQRRAIELLAADLDAATLLGGGGLRKVAIPGPWTVLAGVEDAHGRPLLADAGARREVAASLAEGARALLARLGAVASGSQWLLQLDEPSLPAVLDGRIRTASGWSAIDPVTSEEAEAVLRELTAVAPTVVHCCATPVPVGLLLAAGAVGVSAPIQALTAAQEEVGGLLESGRLLFAGVADPLAPALSDPVATVEPVRTLLARLGIGADRAAASIVLTPDCGLAGTSPDRVVPLLAGLRTAAGDFAADPEGR